MPEGANLCSRSSVSNALPFTNTRHSQPAYLNRMVELMIAVPIRFCSTPGTGNIGQNLVDQQLSGLCSRGEISHPPKQPTQISIWRSTASQNHQGSGHFSYGEALALGHCHCFSRFGCSRCLAWPSSACGRCCVDSGAVGHSHAPA